MANDFNPDLVSIITPSWNSISYIEETIKSVQKQSYSQWEMIIVDDCSVDKSVDLIAHLSKVDPRIRLIKHIKNSGPAAARNTALKNARGRWIAFLDSDDLWLPSKLEEQLAFHKASKAVITYTQFRRISADGSRRGKLIAIPRSLDFKGVLKNTAIATSTAIVDRNLSGSFLMREIYYDDFGCWLDLMRSGNVAKGLEKDLMRYRVMPKSVSRNKLKSALKVWQTFREVEHLGFLQSSWCFLHYAVHGFIKYSRF